MTYYVGNVIRAGKAVLASAVLAGILSCAHMEPPPGGPKDETPLQLVGIYPAPGTQQVSTELYAVAEFSHWLSTPIQDQQIILNPSIPRKLQFKNQGNRLVLTSGSELETETTYSLWFQSGGIKGVHKKGLYTSFVLPFSTGNSMDTTSVEAQVLAPGMSLGGQGAPVYLGLYLQGPSRRNKAYLREPFVQSHSLLSESLVENLVDDDLSSEKSQIHPENPDSIANILSERPYYTLPIDSTGSLNFSWVRPGVYGVVVFEDKNNNLRPDIESEAIGIGNAQYHVIRNKVQSTEVKASEFVTLRLGKLDTAWLQVQSVVWRTVNSFQGELHVTLSHPILESSFLRDNFQIVDQGSSSGATSVETPKVKNAYLLSDNQKLVLTLDNWKHQHFYGVRILGLSTKDKRAVDTSLVYFQATKPVIDSSFDVTDSVSNDITIDTTIKVTSAEDTLSVVKKPSWSPYNFKWGERDKGLHQSFYFSVDTLVDLDLDSLKSMWTLYVDSQQVEAEWKQVGRYYISIKIPENFSAETLGSATSLEWRYSVEVVDSLVDSLGQWQEKRLGVVYFKNQEEFGTVELNLGTDLERSENNWVFVLSPNVAGSNKPKEVEERQLTVKKPSLSYVYPGEYTLYGFQDLDKNGYWSAGSVYPWTKQEPFYQVLSNVKVEKGAIQRLNVKDFYRKQKK